MKRKTLLSLVLAAFLVICGLFSGCQTNENEKPSTPTETVYTLLSNDISLLVGAEYTPDFVLKANNLTVENAGLSYRSLNTETVSVVGGKLKAKKVGVATIEVVASVDGEKVAQASFSCKVNENKGIHPVRNSYVLYVAGSVKGVAFETSSALTAFVYDNGDVVADAQIDWTVADETVAKVDENGRLIAVNVGETYVVGSYTNSKNEVLKTIELPVKVEVPVLVTTDDVIIDKERTVQVFEAQKILGESAIGYIYSVSVNKEYAVLDNQVETALFKSGEHDCVFYNAEKTLGVQVNLVAADFVIYDKEDLVSLAAHTSGYIVLANDISDVSYNSGEKRCFTGVFNGLGHTISNITFEKGLSYGLFYQVNAATFKNVAIVGATLKQASQGTFFYQSKSGETLIDNTYIEVNWDSSVSTVGGVCGYVWRGSLIYSNSICIVDGPMSSNGLITGRNHSQTTVKNSYVLGKGTLSGTANKENNNYATLNRVAGVAYATREEFLTARAKEKMDFSGFNKYWDLSKDIPCM